MADEQVTFALDIESNAADVAPGAANALEALQEQIQGDIVALRNMNAALRNLKGGGNSSAATIKELSARIQAQKAVIANAQQQYVNLGGSFRAPRDGARGTSAALKQLLQDARATSGPIGALAGRLGSLAALTVGGAIAAGVLAVAAAMVALTAATVAATAALARYALAQADARRSESLRLEGLSKHRNYWLAAAGFTLVADKADVLQANIDKVSDMVALGRDKIEGYQASLYKAGLRAGNLQAALEGVSIVAATQGEEAAEAWKGWAMGAALAGTSVRALADDVKARLGGIAARQLLSLDVQARKFRENMQRLFSGLRIEKLLEAINKVTELFSLSTSSGNALKLLAETVLQPLFDATEALGPIVKDFFRGMIIGALEVAIAVQSTRLAFRKAFGSSEILDGINFTTLALYAGIAAVSLLVGAFVALGAVAAIALTPLLVIGVKLWGLYETVRSVYNAITNMGWDTLGTAIITGIVNGLTGGFGLVFRALADLGKGALAAFKRSIQSSSPSRLFFKAAFTAPEGIELAMRAGKPRVQRAAEDLIRMPHELLAAERPGGGTIREPAAPAASASRAALNVNVGDVHVHVAGGDAPAATLAAASDALRTRIEEVFEAAARQLAGALPNG